MSSPGIIVEVFGRQNIWPGKRKIGEEWVGIEADVNGFEGRRWANERNVYYSRVSSHSSSYPNHCTSPGSLAADIEKGLTCDSHPVAEVNRIPDHGSVGNLQKGLWVLIWV